jgi:hypothetical protein
MNFQAPGALLWFLPVGGFILALYLLRLRRRDFVVPASFLWPERNDEVRANSLFQKLRFNWLWVLQLLALALLVLGLARWQVRQTGATGFTTVVIVDVSASMGATDVAPSRFDAAVKRARAIIDSMQAGDRVALIEAGSTPRVATGLSEDGGKLRQGVDSLRRSDAPGDMGESLRLAMALVGRDAVAKIIILSDGCFDPLNDVSRGKAEVVYERFGEKTSNLAVSALGTAETPQGRQAYVGVKNTGLDALESALTVKADGMVVFSEKIAVGSKQTVGRTIRIPANTEVVVAELDRGGFLQADDRRLVAGDPAGSVRILLVTKGNLFLETALSLDARVVLDKATEVPVHERSVAGKGVYDLVIFDSLPEAEVKAPMVVTFGRSSKIARVLEGTGNQDVLTVDQRGVLDGVEFEGVYFDKVYALDPIGGSVGIASLGKGNLVVQQESPKKRIALGFDLLEGDFPLTVSFPILLGNLVDAASGGAKAGVSMVVTGQTVGLAAKTGGSVLVVDPDGTRKSVPAVNGRFTLRGFDRVGEYRVGEGEDQRRYLVNLGSERESEISPADNLALAGGEAIAAKPSVRFADLWKPLVLAMIAVLAVEWIVFMRRS